MVLYCVRSRPLANRVHSVEADDTLALRPVVAKAATDKYERERIMLASGLNVRAHACPAHYMCVPFPLQSAPKAPCRQPRAQAQRLNCSGRRSGRYTCPAKGVCGLVSTLQAIGPDGAGGTSHIGPDYGPSECTALVEIDSPVIQGVQYHVVTNRKSAVRFEEYLFHEIYCTARDSFDPI